MCKCLIGQNEDEAARLFFVVLGDRIRGSGHKLKIGKFNLNTSRCVFTTMEVKQWNKLLREDVESHL